MRKFISTVLLTIVVVGTGFAAGKPIWTWESPVRKPAWEFNGDMPHDALYSPVVQGNLGRCWRWISTAARKVGGFTQSYDFREVRPSIIDESCSGGIYLYFAHDHL